MRCETCREALSARLDGEAEPHDPTVVDAHLADCSGCRRWLDEAADLSRRVRIVAVSAVPHLPISELTAEMRPSRRLPVLRALLGCLGILQMLAASAQVVLPITGGEIPGEPQTTVHYGHEWAAWMAATGAGFCWVALRRADPAGLIPTLSVFVAVLFLLEVTDLLRGDVGVARLLSHLPLLVAYAAVLALGAAGPTSSSPAALGPHPAPPAPESAQPAAPPRLRRVGRGPGASQRLAR